MKNILILLSLVISTTTLAKTATSSRKPAAEKTASASPSVTTTHTTTTTTSSFHPKDLFEGNNKSELFLSVTEATISTGSGNTSIQLTGMYTYLIKEQIQVGAQIGFGSASYKGGSSSSTDLFALGFYNFTPEINEALFAFGGLGIASVQFGSGSESKAGFRAGAGKRFPILAKVQYVPMAWIQKVADIDPVINLMPVNFSLIF